MKLPDNITLHDWFAGMALQGLLIKNGSHSYSSQWSAAWREADAMMAERARRMAKEEPHPLAGTPDALASDGSGETP